MRQVGIVAAAGICAFERDIERLAEDHANARLIAQRPGASTRIVLDPQTVQTNVRVFELAADGSDAPTAVARSGNPGVLILAFGPRTIRAVTHLDASRRQCERAAPAA